MDDSQSSESNKNEYSKFSTKTLHERSKCVLAIVELCHLVQHSMNSSLRTSKKLLGTQNNAKYVDIISDLFIDRCEMLLSFLCFCCCDFLRSFFLAANFFVPCFSFIFCCCKCVSPSPFLSYFVRDCKDTGKVCGAGGEAVTG